MRTANKKTAIKCRASFYLILAAILSASLAVFVLIGGIAGVFIMLFGILAVLYWSVYFYSLKYEISENGLKIQNGVFIRRTRKIELSEIVLETKIHIGGTVFVTILRTAGGSVLIFGELPS